MADGLIGPRGAPSDPGGGGEAESLSPVSIHLEAAPITSPRASSRGQRPLPAVHVATGRALPLAYIRGPAGAAGPAVAERAGSGSIPL